MWLFITKRLRLWLLFGIALPLASVLVHLIRTAVERRTGSTRLTRALARLEELGQRRSRSERRRR